MGTVFRETLNTTRSWLQGVFKGRIFQISPASFVRFAYPQEIQVSQPKVSVPAGTTAGSRASPVEWGSAAPQQFLEGEMLVQPPGARWVAGLVGRCSRPVAGRGWCWGLSQC